MKVIAISDLHGNLPIIEKCDVLCIAGDICPITNHSNEFQLKWLKTTFVDWLKKLPVHLVLVVAGNHDWVFMNPLLKDEIITKWYELDIEVEYLQDESFSYAGKLFYGTPWQPVFCDWAFNQTESQLEEKFNKIPKNVDVLITHGPPYGLCDTVFNRMSDPLGSKSLRKAILDKNPKYVVCGHIHTGCHEPININKISVINVSVLNEQYEMVYDPFVFNL